MELISIMDNARSFSHTRDLISLSKRTEPPIQPQLFPIESKHEFRKCKYLKVVCEFEVVSAPQLYSTHSTTPTHAGSNRMKENEEDWDSSEKLHQMLLNIILCKDRNFITNRESFFALFGHRFTIFRTYQFSNSSSSQLFVVLNFSFNYCSMFNCLHFTFTKKYSLVEIATKIHPDDTRKRWKKRNNVDVESRKRIKKLIKIIIKNCFWNHGDENDDGKWTTMDGRSAGVGWFWWQQ